MGRVAAQYADMAVITSDNPRTEAPMTIIRAIEIGFREIGPRISVSRHRGSRSCHSRAIRLARTGDVVVIAGKGHETYQSVGDQRFPFDDRQIATQVLQDFGYSSASTARIRLSEQTPRIQLPMTEQHGGLSPRPGRVTHVLSSPISSAFDRSWL